MLASKEQARRALRALGRLEGTGTKIVPEHAILRAFLDAAERRLPTEAAYKRDRDRRRAKV